MSTADVTALIVAICLVPLGGLLACVDSALARVSVARVEEFVREERKGATALRVICHDRVRYTNLLLLLRVTAELTATALATVVARAQFGTHWPVLAITVLIMVVVSYAIIGVGPRTLGRQHPYAVALAGASAVRALGRVFGPLASLLILLGNAITPGRGYREGPFSSEVELRELVDMAEERGVVEHGERQMIQSVFELGDTIAREVMVPRTEVVWINRDKTVPQAMTLALRSGFSRIPVTGENADDIVGVVYLKDLARRGQDADRARNTRVEDVMRAVSYVPESKPVDELLREMQAQRTHIAIVIDEYGGTAGLVTIEDILEEIVGEIADEYDVERAPIERIDETLVNNAETLANVTHILARGPEWFRTMGTLDSPGTVVCTVTGDVADPGVFEVEMGTPLRLVLDRAGGAASGRSIRAVFPGVSNAALTADQLDTPLSYEAMRDAGSGLGSAGFIVYDDTACLLAVARTFSRFLFVESCGQCPPCKLGTGAITDMLDQLAAGGSDKNLGRISERLRIVTDASRCYLPAQEQAVIASILRSFPEDVVDHLEGRCGRRHDIVIPKITDLAAGTVRYDRQQQRKRPDWTYEPAAGDEHLVSGTGAP